MFGVIDSHVAADNATQFHDVTNQEKISGWFA
jgi:hypothetical protein